MLLLIVEEGKKIQGPSNICAQGVCKVMICMMKVTEVQMSA